MGVISGQQMNKGKIAQWRNPVKRMGAGNAGYKRQEV